MVYVYAIVDSPAALPDDQRGLADAALELCAAGTVRGVFSRHDSGARLSVNAENVWRHGQVVERLMRESAVLPARFGTRFASEAKLREALRSHADALAEGLGRVRGCDEIGLRVYWEAPPARPPALQPESGRAYMEARLSEERRRRELQARAEGLASALHAPLAGHAIDSTRRVLPVPSIVMTGAYLVPRERADAFKKQLEALASDHADLRLVCTGPWPPYNFVPPLAGAVEA